LVFFFLTLISATASAIQELQLTQNGSQAFTPAIYGDNVVWSDYANDSGTIHLYNLTTFKDIQLDSFHGSWPAIYSNKVVWVDHQSCGNSENYNLSVYDI
jgi:beta propeller repeat protein